MAIGSRCDGRGLGLPLADPIIGLLMTMAIVAVLRGAVRDIFRRLIDGVDPGLVDAAEAALAAEPGVTEVRSVRWDRQPRRPGFVAPTPRQQLRRCRVSTRSGRGTPDPRCCRPVKNSALASFRGARWDRAFSPVPSTRRTPST